MGTTYILLTNEEIADLVKGKEIDCSLNGTGFAIMLEQAFKDTYLGKESSND